VGHKTSRCTWQVWGLCRFHQTFNPSLLSDLIQCHSLNEKTAAIPRPPPPHTHTLTHRTTWV